MRTPTGELPPLTHRHFAYGLRTGANLELPAVDLTEQERIKLVATVARSLGLPQLDEHIRDEWAWAWHDDLEDDVQRE